MDKLCLNPELFTEFIASCCLLAVSDDKRNRFSKNTK